MAKQSIFLSAQVVLDVGDIERSTVFWAALLDQEPSPLRANGKMLTVGSLAGTVWLVLQQVPESKTVKNRVHLDFAVANVDEAVRRILALGGTKQREIRGGGGISSLWLTLIAMNFAKHLTPGHEQGSAFRLPNLASRMECPR